MRYKDRISDISVPDEDILSLRPIKYSDKSDVEEFGESARQYFGFIAEEVVEKESLRDLVMFDDEGKPESLIYDRIVPLLLQVCKNQRSEIDSLKARLDAAGL